MQQVVEFRKKHFWSGRLNMDALNQQIEQYRAKGWRVVTIRPLVSTFGVGGAYLLLLENDQLNSSPSASHRSTVSAC